MQLVIVESPTKARTLSGILGKDYVVKASMGHVRDLPKSGLGVDIEHNFEPKYVITEKAKSVISELKKYAKKAQSTILATDPDREGEAIAWHLKELLELNDTNYGRAVFHEITKDAVLESFKKQGKIDLNLVDAQQARRILDRLVGYKLSPLLWKKVRYGLSAGRVQSVAVRIIVERERERQNFCPSEYWSVEGVFVHKNGTFSASLIEQPNKKLNLSSKNQVDLIVSVLEKSKFRVSKVSASKRLRNPLPPFKTSTLQQSASNAFGFSAYRTMKAAQTLFEKGLITYHRTDSTNLSSQFIGEARKFLAEKFSKDYLPSRPNVYKNVSKNSQEAHEAIRVTRVDLLPKSAEIKSLSGDEQKLYRLIWKRALECQMSPALYNVVSVDILSDTNYLFRTSGSVIDFDGWLGLSKNLLGQEFEEVPEVSQEDVNGLNYSKSEASSISTFILPTEIKEGDTLKLEKLSPSQHFTQPPARYTDASLVKAMEELGVGRPSTYAPTIETIISRGYVVKEGRYFVPQDVAYVVNDLLVKHFEKIVDYGFTALMEEELDEIAEGRLKWQPVVKRFYEPFEELVKRKDEELKKQDVTFLGESQETCPKCGRKLIYKLGKYGKFLSCSGYPECDFAKPVEETITTLLDEENSDESSYEKEENQTTEKPQKSQFYGKCELCHDGDYVLKQSKFGKFLACSRYPDCKSTKPFLTKVGIKCPQCGVGDVVVRKSKGRVFYGCSRYPECKYSSWKKPSVQEVNGQEANS